MRLRSVIPGKVVAWCDGRWGPRHVRVDEVAAIAKAEEVYDRMVRDRPEKMCVGADGELSWLVAGRPLKLRWVLRSNRIWRGGRVFLLCPVCHRTATRVYLVKPDTLWPACRNCLSLAYESQQRNYRHVGVLRELGMSSRDLAKRQTALTRQTARRVARERAARRRSVRSGSTTRL